MTIKRPLVSVVDDDESVRESLPDLLREFGYVARAFSSAEEFLASDCVGQTRSLILDLSMPGMTGPDLQQQLKLCRQQIPIIFITAHADESVRARMLERGAVECLFKPFSDTALLEAFHAALRGELRGPSFLYPSLSYVEGDYNESTTCTWRPIEVVSHAFHHPHRIRCR